MAKSGNNLYGYGKHLYGGKKALSHFNLFGTSVSLATSKYPGCLGNCAIDSDTNELCWLFQMIFFFLYLSISLSLFLPLYRNSSFFCFYMFQSLALALVLSLSLPFRCVFCLPVTLSVIAPHSLAHHIFDVFMKYSLHNILGFLINRNDAITG